MIRDETPGFANCQKFFPESFPLGEVEASRREARVPREGDPVSALPTTPCVSSTSGSSPFCLLDVRLVLWGLWEAIIANNSLLSACVMSDTYPCS